MTELCIVGICHAFATDGLVKKYSKNKKLRFNLLTSNQRVGGSNPSRRAKFWQLNQNVTNLTNCSMFLHIYHCGEIVGFFNKVKTGLRELRILTLFAAAIRLTSIMDKRANF